MGKNLIDIPKVRHMFECANEMLRTNLMKTCLEGPSAKLDQTLHCQPAVYTVSLAAVTKLQEDDPDVSDVNYSKPPQVVEKCVATAGFSLGEVTALVFAGALTFEQGLHLVRVRAHVMHEASERVKGAMCSVFLDHTSQLKLAILAAKNHCETTLRLDKPYCAVVNYLYSECKVVAGNLAAIEFIEQNAAQFGIRRVKRLQVSGAFHTPLMESATKPFSNAFASVGEIKTPAIPVLSAVDLVPYRSSDNIKRKLVSQLVRPVLWEQTLQAMYERPPGAPFPVTVEPGPGRQLGAMLRMVNRKAFERYKSIEV
ncbi:unnamed protein product [Echinostoma caproni]|uniref:[acyl-carrier-protein] S-malonyltransferase n=1 Tax=Echinostoma caproni TaxID=27848 RepID=A0A183ALM2_9TREM|nr:unnamed protein product [Echinostoma caproni]